MNVCCYCRFLCEFVFWFREPKIWMEHCLAYIWEGSKVVFLVCFLCYWVFLDNLWDLLMTFISFLFAIWFFLFFFFSFVFSFVKCVQWIIGEVCLGIDYSSFEDRNRNIQVFLVDFSLVLLKIFISIFYVLKFLSKTIEKFWNERKKAHDEVPKDSFTSIFSTWLKPLQLTLPGK